MIHGPNLGQNLVCLVHHTKLLTKNKETNYQYTEWKITKDPIDVKTLILTQSCWSPRNIWQNKLWEILKEMGIADHLTCLLRNLYEGQEQQLELDMEQQTGSK